jgi:hypothetical protein
VARSSVALRAPSFRATEDDGDQREGKVRLTNQGQGRKRSCPLTSEEKISLDKGIDSLAGVCRQQFQVDPFAGALFVFRNRAATAVSFRQECVT